MGDAPLSESEPGFAHSSSLLDNSMHVVWKDFDLAVTEFCYSQSLQYDFIDLEWFGSHGLLFLVNKLIENELEKRSLEMKFSSTEASFEEQVSINRNLRSQLTRSQRAAQDTEWRLQEQLVQAENHLQLEKSQNLTLRNQIDQLNTQVDRISELHSENNSNYGDGSVMTSPASTMSTPAMTWRDSSR
eukprot:gene25004-28266_t